MAPPGAITSVITNPQWRVGRKITAGARTLFINAAAYRLTDLAFERDATWWRCISAEHAHQRGGQGDGQFRRHAPIPGKSQINTIKIDAKSRTTSATAKTGKIRHSHRFLTM